MSYIEAALQILKASRRPLTTREITERALERGLVIPQGRTPHATMRAALYGRLGTDARLVKTESRTPDHPKQGAVYWTLRETATNTRLARSSAQESVNAVIQAPPRSL
jgi:hypothetical protein